MKYLRYFATKAEYDAAVAEGLATPNVSYVEGESGCHYLVAETKSTIAGDIAYYDGAKICFCSKDDWQSSLGTPIGVVVIPSSHRDDGKSVVVSLANMSLKTPETGSLARSAVEGDNYMMWGKYGTDLPLTNYKSVPIIDLDGGTSSGTGSYGHFQMDGGKYYYEEGGVPYNGERTVYDWGSEELVYERGGYKHVYEYINGFVISYHDYKWDSDNEEWLDDSEDNIPRLPSPYNTDGSKNPNYSVEGTALEDMDGKANTDVIVNAISATYKGGAQVQNEQDAYPAANCTSRYHTDGTNAGDWYLPSIGELGYLATRYKNINASLAIVGVAMGDHEHDTLGTWMWGSTEFSQTAAWRLLTDISLTYASGKLSSFTNFRVRAFCAL